MGETRGGSEVRSGSEARGGTETRGGNEVKAMIHDMVKNSDLVGIKEWVDSVQSGLLAFDDPSLVMMAIEVYLDPDCYMTDERFQLEIIEVLLKCGLRYWMGGSSGMSLAMYLWTWWSNKNKEASLEEPSEELKNEEVRRKVLKVCQLLLDSGDSRAITDGGKEDSHGWGSDVTEYLFRNQAAIRIQRWWRKGRTSSSDRQ